MPLPFDYRELSPPLPALDAIWEFRVAPSSPVPLAHVVLPDACMDVISRWDPGSVAASIMVAGPSKMPSTIEVSPDTRFVGVRLNPAWGGACLGLDPVKFVDQVFPAPDNGKVMGRLSDLLARAERGSIGAASRDIAAALTTVVAPDRRVIEAVRLLRTSGGRMTPKEVADLIGVPTRTLRRAVTAAVGLSPKTLARAFRFRRSVRLRREDGALSLAALAQEAGYADQAHMTRQFRELGGFSPARFPPLLVG